MGTLLTAILASDTWGGDVEVMSLLGLQAFGILVTLVYSGIVTFLLVKVVDAMIGIRVTAEEEGVGLDLSLHDERGFSL